MRISARVIIFKDDEILLMHRKKKSREYYVIPGGGIDEGETPEEAAIREIKEETNLDICLKELFLKIENMFFYTADYAGGELKIGGPEDKKQSEDNSYRLEWIKLKDVKNLFLVPEGIKEKINDLILNVR
ncbi:NUDIX domain-containing protein [Nanoarchaeota archaeon]